MAFIIIIMQMLKELTSAKDQAEAKLSRLQKQFEAQELVKTMKLCMHISVTTCLFLEHCLAPAEHQISGARAERESGFLAGSPKTTNTLEKH